MIHCMYSVYTVQIKLQSWIKESLIFKWQEIEANSILYVLNTIWPVCYQGTENTWILCVCVCVSFINQLALLLFKCCIFEFALNIFLNCNSLKIWTVQKKKASLNQAKSQQSRFCYLKVNDKVCHWNSEALYLKV